MKRYIKHILALIIAVPLLVACNDGRIAHFAGCFFCIRCSIAQIAGWLYSEYSKSLYTFAMQSEA